MIRNKKGVSVIIGYVILISIGIIMSLVVYNYLKTYVPKDAINCPEGVSILITDYDCKDGSLNITIKNNGKFNHDGYYIHASENDTEVATTNFVTNFNSSDRENTQGVGIPGMYVSFGIEEDQLFKPNGELIEHRYLFEDFDLKFIEITPIRWQTYNTRKRLVTCGDAKIKQDLDCD